MGGSAVSGLVRALPGDAPIAALIAGARRDDARGGALDLTGAAMLEADVHHERARLMTRGFREGAARWWTASGATAQVTLLRLRDHRQAELSLADTRDSLEAAGARVRWREPGRPPLLATIIADAIAAGIASAVIGDVHLIAIVATAATDARPAR
jgi:hypothetical protein